MHTDTCHQQHPAQHGKQTVVLHNTTYAIECNIKQARFRAPLAGPRVSVSAPKQLHFTRRKVGAWKPIVLFSNISWLTSCKCYKGVAGSGIRLSSVKHQRDCDVQHDFVLETSDAAAVVLREFRGLAAATNALFAFGSRSTASKK